MYLVSISFVPEEFRFYCYGNNVAMAIEKYVYDCVTRWTTQLFLTESCAEIIASGASCLAKIPFEFLKCLISIV